MEWTAASKQLGSLFPAYDAGTRIAVVGGGPSGLSAALALVRLGYKNVTVLEQNCKVGGMCGSELIEGHVYDLGGQVIARESSPTIDTLIRELGVELEELGHQTFSKIDDGMTGEYEDLKIVRDVVALLPITSKLQEAGRATGKLGVHAVSSLAHELSTDYLRSRAGGHKGEVPKAVADLFTGSGYGYVEHMPYAYLHEFVSSCLGEAWRVKGGYDSFWQKLANLLPDVRCNVQVQDIRREGKLVKVAVLDRSMADSVAGGGNKLELEFDKLIMSGSVTIPKGNRTYLSKAMPILSGEDAQKQGILDYTVEELDLFSRVEPIEYYTTVLKISGWEHLAPRFYYPDHASDVSSLGRYVTLQKFYADTNIFLFWSYGSAEVDQARVTELLYEDVEKLGGHIDDFILQRKFRYFPHVSSEEMASGFYDKLERLQGKNNTYFVGGLMAFELTERNSSFAINLMAKHFGSAVEPISIKRLVEYPLPNGATEPASYDIRELTELPGIEYQDLPTVDAYLKRYAQHPVTRDRILYTWLDDQGKESCKLTFAQLDARASVVASHLLTSHLNLEPGDRVVLLHPPGLEFIEAFLGCLRARILAVPLIPPDPTKRGGDLALEKLRNVVKVTNAKAILSTRSYRSVLRASSISMLGKGPIWPNLPWIETNALSDDELDPSWPQILRNKLRAAASSVGAVSEVDTDTPPLGEVCFLQFTSGSTGDAKGVMITHGALVHNTKSMRAAYRATTRTVCISWLPQYHDMGLIGGLLTSLVCGGHLIMFSPITFIRKPMIWLEMVGKYRATHTAAPNFGFELVLKRLESLKILGKEPKFDLSSLHFLMAGAEPISPQTMRSFVETFWDAGVREEIFAPGFGLAENCVFICCAYGRKRPIMVDSDGRVSCGYIESGKPRYKDICADVRIVNPDTLEEVREGVEGEIWISSESNGIGYWGMEEATKETFGVRLKNAAVEDSEIGFVRTGDLGRSIKGNLFVTGRIKDLIIVNGRNYYPSDIEKTVENCSQSLRPGCSAAFSAPAKVLRTRGVVWSSDSDGIVVVAEVRDENHVDPDLVANIKAAVADVHAVQVAFVNLIKPRTIPKTTSGKIRRRECLKRFSEGTLSSIKIANVFRAQARLRRSKSRMTSGSQSFKRLASNNWARPASRPGSDSVVSFARAPSSKSIPSTGKGKGKTEVSNFLVSLVADITGRPKSEISVTESFENYSIDSHGAVLAASKLSEFLGLHISAIQIYTTGCISELADLCTQVAKKSGSALASGPGSRSKMDRMPSVRNTSFKSSGSEIFMKQQHDLIKVDNEDDLSDAQLADALDPSRRRKFYITALQVTGMFYIGSMLIVPIIYIYKQILEAAAVEDQYLGTGSIVSSVVLVPLAWMVYIAFMPIMLSTFGARILLPMNAKTLTAKIPLWSVDYVRWWTLYRLQDFASSNLATHLRGTVFLSFWYRSLGADIGNGVYLDTTEITDPWLVSIGHRAVINEGATIQSHEVNAGVVRFRNVKIGKEAVVGPYALLQRGSVLEAGSTLGALGMTDVVEYVSTPEPKQSPPKQTRFGKAVQSSAKPLKIMSQLSGLYMLGLVSSMAGTMAYWAFQWVGSYLEIMTDATLTEAMRGGGAIRGCVLFSLALTFPRYAMILTPLMLFPNNPALLAELLMNIVQQGKFIALLFSVCVAYIAFGVTLCVVTCAFKWCLVGRAEEGTSDRKSLRKWLVQALLRSTHEKFMSALMGTEPLCMYLRMLGAEVGRLASIRKVNAIIDPDLIKLGDGCHLGDFCKIITSEVISGGSVYSSAVSVGDGCVVGAQSVVMPGATFERNSALGAMSVASTGTVLEEGAVYVGDINLVKVKASSKQGERDPLKSTISIATPELEIPENIRIFNKDPLMFNLDSRFRQIIASCAGEFARKTPAGHHRYIHHLGASGRGTMRVLKNVAGLPPHDLFSPGATYPIVIRCSTGNSKNDDRLAEVRGATLRILRPDSPDDLEAPILDLFMKTGEFFHARNMVDFLGYYIMSEEERVQRIRDFPPLGESQWDNLRRPKTWADLHYFGSTCRYFQALKTSEEQKVPQGFYVKCKLRPSDPSIEDTQDDVDRNEALPPIDGMLPALPNDSRPPTCLRDDFKNRLESPEGIKYVLQLQFHAIPSSPSERDEVEDPTRVWDKRSFPYIDVAEVWLNEHVDDSVFDKIHFNPRFGPESFAMITGTSAIQAASIDTGRSVIHDLLTNLRSGKPLPTLWNDLLKKSYADLLPATTDQADEGNHGTAVASGCPMMSTDSASSKNISAIIHEENIKEKSNSDQSHTGPTDQGKKKGPSLARTLTMAILRFIQPILQVEAPLVFMFLALYPSVMGLAWLGARAGQNWMLAMVPIGFIFWGLLFSTLTIVCKWIVVWRIKDGKTSELWSFHTLLLTVWEAINQLLGSLFMELGRGSILCTLYFQSLGASIKTTGVYIDTLHVLNPDQFKLGYRSAIGRNALIFGHLYEGEKVGFKSTFIGDDTCVGTRALVLPGLKMEEGAELPGHGLGMKDEVIRAIF